MGGSSGSSFDPHQFDAQDDQLTQAEDFMRQQSLNTLNKEMVRTQTDFGFGNRPEPRDLPTDVTLNLPVIKPGKKT